MFKAPLKSVHKHFKFTLLCVGFLHLCVGASVAGEMSPAATENDRGYIWNTGLVQILEEAGVAVASPRSVDPKLRLHFYLGQCDQLMADGDVAETDVKIQEALLDLSGMKGLQERQARVAEMLSNHERANSYWASVVSHPGATLDNFADAAWSYLLTGQIDFGELVLEMGEKEDAGYPKIQMLRHLYQKKKGDQQRSGVLYAEDIPSLVFRATHFKTDMEVLGGGQLFDELCLWLIRGAELPQSHVMMEAFVPAENGAVLPFSDERSVKTDWGGVSSFSRVQDIARLIRQIQNHEVLEHWETMLSQIEGIRDLGGSGLYVDLLEMTTLGNSGRRLQCRALGESLLERYPDQGALFFEWAQLLMDWEAYAEALRALEQCRKLGYFVDAMDAWLAACNLAVYQDAKAEGYIVSGLRLNNASAFKQQISQRAAYWLPVRHEVSSFEAARLNAQ